MATKAVSPVGKSAGIVNTAYGKFTSDGNDALITLGFVPSMVKIINETDAIVWDAINGMTATKVAKTDTAVAIDTGSAIVIGTDGTVALSSTLCGTSKVLAWVAYA